MVLSCRRHISFSGFFLRVSHPSSLLPGVCAKNFWSIAVYYPLPRKLCAQVRMGLQGVELDGVEFSGKITPPTSASVLELVGHGMTGMEIETVEIKFTNIGLYAEPSITEHLQKWKGKPATELVDDDSRFHKELIQTPVEKLVRISIIKGVKGTPYGGSLQSSLRDRLVNDDKYEEAEEEALDKLVDFFQPHNFPKGANIIYHWPTPSTVKISISADTTLPEDVSYTIEDANVAEALLDLYLGENTITPTTLSSLAETIAAQLAKEES